MKHANIVGLDDLKLTEITTATANQATATIAGHALDRADLLHLLDVIRPAPHNPAADPATRRALPRRSA